MIPAAFDYVRAGSLAEAIDLLQRDPEGTKLVAGGHTLIPTLKLRLASPALLVDIRGIADMKGISVDDKAHPDRRTDDCTQSCSHPNNSMMCFRSFVRPRTGSPIRRYAIAARSEARSLTPTPRPIGRRSLSR